MGSLGAGHEKCIRQQSPGLGVGKSGRMTVVCVWLGVLRFLGQLESPVRILRKC